MSRKQKILVLILLVIFLTPQVELWHNKDEVWQFGNLHYIEHSRCFDAMPLPIRSWQYKSMFIRTWVSLDYCEEWQWAKNSYTISSADDNQNLYLALYIYYEGSPEISLGFFNIRIDFSNWKLDFNMP